MQTIAYPLPSQGIAPHLRPVLPLYRGEPRLDSQDQPRRTELVDLENTMDGCQNKELRAL